MDSKLMGRLGGKARARNMTPEERRDAARRAAIIRWTLAKNRKTKKPAA